MARHRSDILASKTSPTDIERNLRQKGFHRIAGLDEVGRGCLAGPVLVCAVVLPLFEKSVPSSLNGLRDSKELTEKQRSDYADALNDIEDIEIGYGVLSASSIDLYGITLSVAMCVSKAVMWLDTLPDHLICDRNCINRDWKIPQSEYTRGENQSLSIAAASVLAKVRRDAMMREYGETYPEYGFETHKGYGTQKHMDAIRTHGVTELHRRSFEPIKTMVSG